MEQTALDINSIKAQAADMIRTIEQLEIEHEVAVQSKQKLEASIRVLQERIKDDKEALDIATHAIEILREVSDEAVNKAYAFLEESLNSALDRMFVNRKIKIKEYTRGNQYPQLEIELHVENGIVRSLKTDSGHGIAQIVSLLSILTLICLTGSRRILVMDEVISGLSVNNRKIVNDILWSFTEIGFQFIINDHGFIPEGSHVYHLEMNGGVSGIKEHYIADKGVYLQGGSDAKNYDYSQLANARVFVANSNGTLESSIDNLIVDESPELIESENETEDSTVTNNTSTDNQILSI